MDENRASTPPPTILFDTTLRDGEQAPGVALTPAEKAEYIRRAEDAGIRYIEVGFPQNALDLEACRAAVEASRHARLVAMALTNSEGVERVSEVGAHEILFVVPCSTSHLDHVYGHDLRTLIDQVLECSESAAARGLAINIGLEDASQRDMEVIYQILEALTYLGDKVDCITIPDTRGQLLPSEVVALITNIRANLPNPKCRLAFHAHDDLGLATANSLAALQMHPPVDCIHATVCGFGERAGNASLEQMAVLLDMKLALPQLINLKKLQSLAEYVGEIFLTPLSAHAPIVGSKVFLHESGLHQKGVLHDQSTYQYLDPSLFGRETGLILGKHSGKHLRQWIAESAECEEEEVWNLQAAIIDVDKSEARSGFRDGRGGDLSILSIGREDAVKRLKASRVDRKRDE